MFSSFAKPITSLIQSHPGVAFASAFAAVAAPAFLKDENRGYLRTALVTTPVVAAMAFAGPGMMNAASRTTRSGLRFVREAGPFFFGKNLSVNYKDLRNYVESGTVDLGALNPALRNWVDDSAVDFFSQVDRGAPPIEHSMESAMGIFNRLMPDEGKRTLLTYAVEGARLRAASPLQLANASHTSPMAAMAESDLRGIVAANRADPRFVKELSTRLRWAERLKDSGMAVSPLVSTKPSTVNLNLSEHMNRLVAQRPDVASALQTAMNKGSVESATLVAEQTTSGEIGRLLGIHLKGPQGELQLPIFDPSTGKVSTGRDFQQTGVGRRLYNKQGYKDLDVFVAQNLTENWGTLKKDIGRAATYNGIDPTDVWKVGNSPDSVDSLLSPFATYLASQKAVPTGLNQFEGGSTWDKLTPLGRVKQRRDMLTNWNMIAMGSEGGLVKGNLEMGGLSNFVAGGVIPTGRQSAFYQSFSKSMQLDITGMREHLKPYYANASVEAMGGVPEVRTTVTGVSAQQRALFGDMPSQIADLPGYSDTAIQRIMNDTGLSRPEAMKAWEKVSGKLTAREGFYDAARRFGSMGEGSILLHEKFGRYSMESHSPVRVDALHMNVQEAMKRPFGPDKLIGFSGLTPVTSNAAQTYIEKVNPLVDASGSSYFEIMLRKLHNLKAGSKIQVGGVKGQVSGVVPADEFSRMRELLNIYGEATGGDIIPNYVDAIAPMEHTLGKFHDPFNVLLQQAFEVSNQVVRGQTTMNKAFLKAGYDTKALTAVNNYMSDLAAKGIQSVGGRFVEDVSAIPQGERYARMQDITTRTTSFFEEMGPLVKHGHTGTTGSSLFSSFRQSKTTNFLEYMQKHASPASMAAWHSTEVDVPQITSVTEDMFSEMFRLGHGEGMQDIMGRLEFQGGDPVRAAEFAKHFVGQDFKNPLGNVIPIEQAVPGAMAEGINLGTMQSRIGGIFDPTNAAVQENFSLAFKEPVFSRSAGRDVERSYLYVLGKKAQGGGSNLFEKPGEGLSYSATDYEKALANVVKFQNEPTLLQQAVSDFDTETSKILFGKKGFYRPQMADPGMAVSGFLEARALPGERFTTVIPEQMARRFRDEKVRRALGMEMDVELGHEVLRHPGMEVYATVFRHPIQSTPYMKVRVDTGARLGPNEIAMDPATMASLGADVDRDAIQMAVHTPGSAAEEEAKAAISDLNSSQNRQFDIHDLFEGGGEDFRSTMGSDIKSMPELIAKEFGGNPVEGVVQRASGGEGAYSNMLTNLNKNIEMHPTIGTNQESRTLLGQLFWPVRQVPIAVKKGHSTMNPEDPLAVLQQIQTGLAARSEEGVAVATEGLRQVFVGHHKESILNERTAKLYTELTGKPGVAGEVKPHVREDFLMSPRGQSLLNDFVVNRNPAADAASSLITKDLSEATSKEMYGMHASFKKMGPAIPYMQGIAGEKRSGNMISRVLGAINEGIRSSAKVIGESKGLKIAAIGLGVAAAASVLTSHIKSPIPASAAFSTGSGSFRPEERTNVSDHVPGEPMAGSMSSVNPPRRQLNAVRGVGTTMVAPMHQRSDLEVRMKAQSRSDTTEIQRMTGQMGGSQGVSNVNVNYRNGWRNKMSTLRQRQTIRESLDE